VKEAVVKLRVDTSQLTFLVVAAGVPVRDFESGRAKIEDGQPLFSIRMVVMDPGSGEAEIINVKVPGEPVGLIPGQPVKLHELTAQPWNIGDKSGVAFRASGVEPATTRARNGAHTG
jgi:hypothetical protein